MLALSVQMLTASRATAREPRSRSEHEELLHIRSPSAESASARWITPLTIAIHIRRRARSADEWSCFSDQHFSRERRSVGNEADARSCSALFSGEPRTSFCQPFVTDSSALFGSIIPKLFLKTPECHEIS